MANATITGTASNFGSISGVLAGDAGTVAGSVTGVVTGDLSGSVGVPGAQGPTGATGATGPQGPQGDPGPAGEGVPAGGLEGQILAKASDTSYDTAWQDNYATELRIVARNETGSTLARGTVVYINGASGNKPTLAKALATGDATSAQTVGMVSDDIPNNQNGEVTVRGLLAGLDTSAFTAGTQLYLSGTTAGAVTSTKPVAPVHLVYVGIVSRQHANQGQVEVAVQNGFELHELHDVKITSVSNGQVLKYDSAQGLWVNGTDVGGVAWGGITGTLSDQTDLNSALNAKLNASSPSAVGDLTITGSFTTLTASSALLKYAHSTNIEYSELTRDSFTLFADTADKSVEITNAGIRLYDPAASAAATITFPDNSVQSIAFPGFAGYATESYVTTALGSYLTTSAASSTYLTQANAASTYQTQAGMSAYLTTASASSTYLTQANAATTYYPLTGNPSGFLTSAPVTSVAGKTGAVTLTNSDISGLGTMATATASDYLAKADNLSGLTNTGTARTNLGLGTMATETASNYLTTASASSTYAPLASPALTGTPTAPTAAVDTNTTQVATTAYVIGQGYLKSATASSTYAPLASPALTGTPTAPTAAAATNTTQIATTAFVQQEVPAASTSAAGKVQLAAFSNVYFDPSSTTLGLTPSLIPYLLANGNYRNFASLNQTSVSGSAASSNYGAARELYTTSTTAAGRITWMSATYAGAFMNISSAADSRVLDFSKKIWIFGVAILGRSTYYGNANTVCRVNLGGRSTNATGALTQKGFGFYKVGGASTYVTLTVHNGTTLTDVASTVTVANDATIHYMIYSDGSGNVTLYINGSQAATTSAGPTGTSTAGYNVYEEQLESSASSGTLASMHIAGAGVYISR